MSDAWSHQIRFYLTDAFAEMARSDPDNPALTPLRALATRHDATWRSQLDAFTQYVTEAEAQGIEGFPLYRWTKATLADPDKRDKHLKTFVLRVNGEEVYAKAVADRLEADLLPLVGGPLITRTSRHDNNPANNLPVPAEYRSR